MRSDIRFSDSFVDPYLRRLNSHSLSAAIKGDSARHIF